MSLHLFPVSLGVTSGSLGTVTLFVGLQAQNPWPVLLLGRLLWSWQSHERLVSLGIRTWNWARGTVTSSVIFLIFIWIFFLWTVPPLSCLHGLYFSPCCWKNSLGVLLLMFLKKHPSLPLSSNILVMVRGSWCKIICWHIWFSWQAVHKAVVQHKKSDPRYEGNLDAEDWQLLL